MSASGGSPCDARCKDYQGIARRPAQGTIVCEIAAPGVTGDAAIGKREKPKALASGFFKSGKQAVSDRRLAYHQ